MFATTLMVALSGLVVPAVMDSPSWHADYGSAQKLGREEHKPLALFFGSGKDGWNQLSRDGTLGKEVTQLLAKTYICVYVDTSGESGKQLATEFEIGEGPGLIVSDHSGKYQAFSHRGDLSGELLLRYLRRYADSQRVVRTTETNPTERISYAAPAATYYIPSYYAPVYSGASRSC